MYHPCDTLAADLADSTFSADRLRPHLGACGGLSGREKKSSDAAELWPSRGACVTRLRNDVAHRRRPRPRPVAAAQPDAGTRPRRRRARVVLVKEGSHGRRGRAPRASRAASSFSAAQSLVILKLRAARAAAALGSLSTPLERRSQQTAGPAR